MEAVRRTATAMADSFVDTVHELVDLDFNRARARDVIEILFKEARFQSIVALFAIVALAIRFLSHY